jgi:D-alanyl-D-alanine carboxypeptidase
MEQKSWMYIVLITLGIVLVAALWRFTRRVLPYTPPSEQALTSSGTIDDATAVRLQAALDQELNALRIPGMQAYVRRPDGKTWSGASGTVDLKRRQPMTPEHILRVGSITKTFTAVIVLKLVEQGLISLEDPLSKWFPDFPNAGQITVRMLLNHTSGIPEFIPSILMKSIVPSQYWSPEQVVEIAAGLKPPFTPGSGWSYSNANYVLLGLIAERMTGKSFIQLLHEIIIDPLGLQNTYFIPYEDAPPALVPGWDRDLSKFPGMLDIGVKNTSWATAAFTSGALASNANDVGTFYEALFGGKLLSPESMNEMTDFAPAPNEGFAEQTGYGLGLMQMIIGGRELVGHVGQFMGATAIAAVAPENGFIIVVTSDLSFPDLTEVVGELQAEAGK